MFLKRLKDLTNCLKMLENIRSIEPHAMHIIQHIKTVLTFQLRDFELYEVGGSKEGCPSIVSINRNRITPQVTMFMRNQEFSVIKAGLTELIDWKKCNHFYFIPVHLVPSLKDVLNQQGSEIVKATRFITFQFANVPLSLKPKPSNRWNTRLLDETDVHHIHTHWVYKYGEDSVETVRQCVAMGAGFGVCLDNKLVSWAMLTYRGDIGFWHTLPEVRNTNAVRPMLASILLPHISSKDISPIARIEHGNDASLKASRKSGAENTLLETADITCGPRK